MLISASASLGRRGGGCAGDLFRPPARGGYPPTAPPGNAFGDSIETRELNYKVSATFNHNKGGWHGVHQVHFRPSTVFPTALVATTERPSDRAVDDRMTPKGRVP
eukprot:1632851-Prymnesium_polylepis.1